MVVICFGGVPCSILSFEFNFIPSCFSVICSACVSFAGPEHKFLKSDWIG